MPGPSSQLANQRVRLNPILKAYRLSGAMKAPAGGFVFSTGSISFGGSLLVDPALQAILTNALNEALG